MKRSPAATKRRYQWAQPVAPRIALSTTALYPPYLSPCRYCSNHCSTCSAQCFHAATTPCTARSRSTTRCSSGSCTSSRGKRQSRCIQVRFIQISLLLSSKIIHVIIYFHISISCFYLFSFVEGESVEENPYPEYGPYWDYYVASNLHFYTTLLALFLRTVSLASLNPNDAYGRPFLDTLKKVLDVFSGPLLNKVNELTAEFNSWYNYEIKQKAAQRPASPRATRSSKTPTSARSPLHSPMVFNSRSAPDAHSSTTQASVEVAALRLAIKCQHQYLFPDFDDNFFVATTSATGSAASVIPVVTKACAQVGENLHTSLRRLLRVTPDSYALQAWEAYVEFFKLNGNADTLAHLHHDIEKLMAKLRVVLNRPEASLLRANSSFDPSSDVLDRPTAASEWPVLVLVTVGVSKLLNSLFDLPRDSALVNMEFKESIDYIRRQQTDLKSQAAALLQSARFNFRGLANITVAVVVSFLLVVRFCVLLSLGWLTTWQIIRNIAAPVVASAALRLIEHWYRVETKKASDATNRGLVVWDDRTGKLTDYGKELLVLGNLECKKENLRFIGDELTLPCHSFEYPLLYNLTVRLSNILNSRYNLPKEPDTISLSWKFVFKSAWLDRRSRSPLETIFRASRFNLRFLASKYTLNWGLVGTLLLYILYPFYLKVGVVTSTLLLIAVFISLERRSRA